MLTILFSSQFKESKSREETKTVSNLPLSFVLTGIYAFVLRTELVRVRKKLRRTSPVRYGSYNTIHSSVEKLGEQLQLGMGLIIQKHISFHLSKIYTVPPPSELTVLI
jgi:hypothetical protein